MVQRRLAAQGALSANGGTRVGADAGGGGDE
jgi:hypothetical protein